MEVFTFEIPQGKEVLDWLVECEWDSMAAFFAKEDIRSLRDMCNPEINKNLTNICQTRIDMGDISKSPQELENDLRRKIKKLGEKVLSKSLEERLDAFRDEGISWVNVLFAQHSLEILVTNQASLVLLAILCLGATADFAVEISTSIWGLTVDITAACDTEDKKQQQI